MCYNLIVYEKHFSVDVILSRNIGFLQTYTYIDKAKDAAGAGWDATKDAANSSIKAIGDFNIKYGSAMKPLGAL